MALLTTGACSADLRPAVPASTRLTSSIVAKAPQQKTTLTTDQRHALEVALGENVVAALDGNIAHPYGVVPGSRRPLSDRVIDVDYASVPVMAEAPLDRAHDPVELRFAQRRTPSPECRVGFGHVTWSRSGLGTAPTVAHVDRFLVPGNLPSTGVFENDPESIATLYAISSLAPGARADWTTLDPRGRSTRVAAVSRFEGSYEPSTRTVTANRKLVAQAPALIAGGVYAFRRCVAHCDDDLLSQTREEEIEMVGPTAMWGGSSASTDRQGFPRDQAFTDISVHVVPGSSAALVMSVETARIADFRRTARIADSGDVTSDLLGGPSPPTALTFSFEVVWPLGQSPQAAFFVGAQHDVPAEPTKPPATGYFSDCVPL